MLDSQGRIEARLYMIQDKQVCKQCCLLKEKQNIKGSEVLLNKQHQAQATNHDYC